MTPHHQKLRTSARIASTLTGWLKFSTYGSLMASGNRRSGFWRTSWSSSWVVRFLPSVSDQPNWLSSRFKLMGRSRTLTFLLLRTKVQHASGQALASTRQVSQLCRQVDLLEARPSCIPVRGYAGNVRLANWSMYAGAASYPIVSPLNGNSVDHRSIAAILSRSSLTSVTQRQRKLSEPSETQI